MTPPTTVICAIECSIDQLLGAYVQSLSLQGAGESFEYVLTVVVEQGTRQANIEQLGIGLGMACRLATRVDENRYLNKFLALDGLSDRGRGGVALLDWDVLSVAGGGLPETPRQGVAARPNPADLYQRELSGDASEGAPTANHGVVQLETSVNGGVLVGSTGALLRLGHRARAIVRSEPRVSVMAPAWKQEQCAISMALAQVGLAPLGDEWNVTPLSRVEPTAVRLWHYNDSAAWTRTMKAEMTSPAVVRRLVRENLPETSPAGISFLRAYEQAIGHPLVRMFLRSG